MLHTDSGLGFVDYFQRGAIDARFITQIFHVNKELETANSKVKSLSGQITIFQDKKEKDGDFDRTLQLKRKSLEIETALATTLQNKLNHIKIEFSEHKISVLKKEVAVFEKNPKWHRLTKVIAELGWTILLIAVAIGSCHLIGRIEPDPRNGRLKVFCSAFILFMYASPPEGVLYKAIIMTKVKLEKQIEIEQLVLTSLLAEK
ncbi:MAG: hypothetical protein H0W88_03550 [Parachlamydiaceae bacterium]|nr:hypothetical protein [Parachlamydiaceae bacterium]